MTNPSVYDLLGRLVGHSDAVAGGAPTADTAFLIATAPTIATDANPVQQNLAWDTRFPQVSWLTIVNGTGVITDGAGHCTVGVIAKASLDFTATTPPNDPGLYGGSVSVLNNGSSLVTASGSDVVGNGQNVQLLAPRGPNFAASTDFAPGAVVTVQTQMGAYSDADENIPIPDGVATSTVAIAITRGGSAPTLP